MGKIVKYCASCDESFAEKFAFCPNCGKSMQAFEMNPLAGVSDTVEKLNVGAANGNDVKADAPAQNFTETKTNVEPAVVVETVAASPIIKAQTVSEEMETPLLEIPSNEVEPEIVETSQTPVMETKTFAASAAASNGNGYKSQTSGDGYRTVESQSYRRDDGFHVTVIEEKNVKERNLLLLGSLLLMVTMATGGMIYSLFNHNLSIAAIGDESGLARAIVDDVVPPMEAEKPPKKDKDDGGGGGGGGKEEQKDVSKGRLVSQSENPITPPSPNIPQLKNPSLPVIMETQGNIKRPITEERPGLPGSSSFDPSSGRGSGGGMGRGNGTGLGGGNGTGEGNGNGSGSGNGDGNGYGNGKGNGTGQPPPPPTIKPKPPAVTTKIQILSKPRAEYTDAARQNQVTGTVTVKVTFLANGQIGSVTPVNSLPYGLTEKAIAAAKAIKFEPAKKDGVPYSTIVPVQYNFNIY
ncbi:MAG: zinc ribbon domain-containing protein [Acidobacteriota bacterium]|nr:zinc ribbon domain-containing protein [Acidobacteriota bacterium]